VQDMLDFTETALRYAEAKTEVELLADGMRWDAILRKLELLGEAANRVPADIQALRPELPWRTLVAVRNRLAHAYLSIEPEVVHGILQRHLPMLRDGLRTLLQQRPSL
jgi:uncharacterized protein with HEPN domain